MIFASDLDGTLIFSKRYLVEVDDKIIQSLHLVDVVEGISRSFITKPAKEKLAIINKKMFFVPVTTRTINQYNRMVFFQNEIKPLYAIVSNGGNILMDGKPLEEWQLLIKKHLKDTAISHGDVLKKFKELEISRYTSDLRIADDLFICHKVDISKVEREEFYPFFQWLKSHNWTGSLQGRKLYFIPDCVNKRDSLLFLKERLGSGKLISAGDSLLDIPMLEVADHAISPFHGEIKQCFGEKLREKGIQYTLNEGIEAVEEILDFVMGRI